MNRIAAALLVVCVAVPAARATHEDSIEWFTGDVDQALARARAEKRPLFLYWGAVWCPPCNQIKKTIFTRREFAERMRLFLPVYLDGDTEMAQVWGEKLKASGYPTMIVLSPEGTELMRLPTGLQLEQFLEVLDRAAAMSRPVTAVLEEALAAASGDAVPDATWRILAYYSWGQDALVDKKPADLAADFAALEAKIPPRLAAERSRLYTLWLATRIDAAAAAAEAVPGTRLVPADEVPGIHSRLHEILLDPGLRIVNLEYLILGAADTVKALYPGASPGRTQLMLTWEQAMDRIESDPALSVDERISALVPALEFHKLTRPEGEVPEAFRARVRKAAAWADASATDPYTRQSAMNTACQLLREVGDLTEARRLYLAQLGKAPSPYYFMSGLAAIARDEGKGAEAVEWMEKAYRASAGRATRFQWGSSWLGGLLDLQPSAHGAIEKATVEVLGELLQNGDAFAGRNQARSQRLAKQFAKWNQGAAEHRTVSAIRASLAPRCGDLGAAAAESASRERCAEFFQTLGGVTTAKK